MNELHETLALKLIRLRVAESLWCDGHKISPQKMLHPFGGARYLVIFTTSKSNMNLILLYKIHGHGT